MLHPFKLLKFVVTLGFMKSLNKCNKLLFGSIWHPVHEIVSYSGLLRTMVARDLKVRYRGSVLGFGWSMLSPILMMLVFTVVFNVLTSTDIPDYPLFLLAGLIPWTFTQNALVSAMRSITGNPNLINKVYFPRELLPLSAVLSSFIHFVIAFSLFVLALFVFRGNVSATIWFVPLIMCLHLMFVTGLAMVMAAVNVFLRDLEQVVDIGMLAWFFLTPIFYALSVVPNTRFLGLDIHRWVFTLNPMATLISDYRYTMLYGWLPIRHTAITVLISVFALVLGWWMLRRFAHRFAELV